jgi:uncharacterized membrane protein
MENPFKLIIVAIVLLLMGAILPFLMVMGLLESTLALCFMAGLSSPAGLILGVIGIAMHMRSRK